MKKALIWCVIWFCPALIVSGVAYLNVVAVMEWHLADTLQKHGRPVQGELIDSFETKSIKTTSTYIASYRFTLPNSPMIYQRTRPMDHYQWERGAGGGLEVVDIVYLPKNPRVSDIKDNQVWRGRAFFALFANLVLAGAIWAIRYAAKQQTANDPNAQTHRQGRLEP